MFRLKYIRLTNATRHCCFVLVLNPTNKEPGTNPGGLIIKQIRAGVRKLPGFSDGFIFMRRDEAA